MGDEVTRKAATDAIGTSPTLPSLGDRRWYLISSQFRNDLESKAVPLRIRNRGILQLDEEVEVTIAEEPHEELTKKRLLTIEGRNTCYVETRAAVSESRPCVQPSRMDPEEEETEVSTDYPIKRSMTLEEDFIAVPESVWRYLTVTLRIPYDVGIPRDLWIDMNTQRLSVDYYPMVFQLYHTASRDDAEGSWVVLHGRAGSFPDALLRKVSTVMTTVPNGLSNGLSGNDQKNLKISIFLKFLEKNEIFLSRKKNINFLKKKILKKISTAAGRPDNLSQISTTGNSISGATADTGAATAGSTTAGSTTTGNTSTGTTSTGTTTTGTTTTGTTAASTASGGGGAYASSGWTSDDSLIADQGCIFLFGNEWDARNSNKPRKSEKVPIVSLIDWYTIPSFFQDQEEEESYWGRSYESATRYSPAETSLIMEPTDVSTKASKDCLENSTAEDLSTAPGQSDWNRNLSAADPAGLDNSVFEQQSSGISSGGRFRDRYGAKTLTAMWGGEETQRLDSILVITEDCEILSAKIEIDEPRDSEADILSLWPELAQKGGRVGLRNLGNTCFMNSALQCLSHALPLARWYLYGHYRNDLNVSNPLGTSGQLAQCFARLMYDMWTQGFGQTASPVRLKDVIGRFAPNFRGYCQQDAQELIAFLLDGLHEDGNRVRVKPYIETVDATDLSDDLTTAAEAWKRHKQRNDSIIVDLFQAQLRSRLRCLTCGHVSKTFDPFMYASIPIPQTFRMAINVSLFVSDLEEDDPDWEDVGRSDNPARWSYTFPIQLTLSRESSGCRDARNSFTLISNIIALEREQIQRELIRTLWTFAQDHPSDPLAKSLQKYSKLHQIPETKDSSAFKDALKIIQGQTTATPAPSGLQTPAQNLPSLALPNLRGPPSRGPIPAAAGPQIVPCPVPDSAPTDPSEAAGPQAIPSAGFGLPVTETRSNPPIGSSLDDDLFCPVLGGFVQIEPFAQIFDSKDDLWAHETAAQLAILLTFGGKPIIVSVVTKNDSICFPFVQNFVYPCTLATTGTHLVSNSIAKGALALRDVLGYITEELFPEDAAMETKGCPGDRADAAQGNPMDEGKSPELSLQECLDYFQSGSCEVFIGIPGTSHTQNLHLAYLWKKNVLMTEEGQKVDDPIWIFLNKRKILDSLGMLRLIIQLRPGPAGPALQHRFDRVINEGLIDVTGCMGEYFMNHKIWRSINLVKSAIKSRPWLFKLQASAPTDSITKEFKDHGKAVYGYGMGTDEMETSLANCLEEFSTEEILHGTNQWYCSKCKEFRDATKKIDFYTLPDILVVHLKRFTQDLIRTYRRSKLSTFVRFPWREDEFLEMGPFLPKTSPHYGDSSKCRYKLFAVSQHRGSLSGGHYTACVKCPGPDGSKEWVYYSDMLVRPLGPDEDEEAVANSDAYILFYERLGEECFWNQK